MLDCLASLSVVAALVVEPVFHVEIVVEVWKQLRHAGVDLLVLVVGGLGLATEDPDTRVARGIIAVVVDGVGLVVGVDNFEDRHSGITVITDNGRIHSVAQALFGAVAIQISDFVVLGGTGHHVQVAVLDVEVVVVVLKRVEVRAHTSLSHEGLRWCALRQHVPHTHVVVKGEIHACRVVANV